MINHVTPYLYVNTNLSHKAFHPTIYLIPTSKITPPKTYENEMQ